MFKCGHYPEPTQTHTVNPGIETAVIAGQMAKLVGQHRAHFFRGQSQHQRIADDKVIPVPAEYSQTWVLHYRSIEIVIQNNPVNSDRLQLLAQTVNFLKQTGAFFSLERVAFRRFKTDPERLQKYPDGDQNDKNQFFLYQNEEQGCTENSRCDQPTSKTNQSE